MSKYVLMTDATLDLPDEVVKELDIHVIPMNFEINGSTYHHYPDERELSSKEFYKFLKDGEKPTTAQVTPFVYEELFRSYLKQGIDVICVVFSSGLSGTYQSANIARGEVAQKYPDRKVYCIDSKAASVGLGVLMYHAAKKRLDGMEIDELNQWISDNKFNARHWFTVEDLFHLNRGGRLSSLEAIVGTALKIKPILSIDKDGKLFVASKVRGTKKAISFLIDKLKEEGTNIKEQTVIIGHGDNIEQAEIIREKLLEEQLVKDAIITNIGPIIGTHTGPGMLALVFMA